jgi:hypothetical protein
MLLNAFREKAPLLYLAKNFPCPYSEKRHFIFLAIVQFINACCFCYCVMSDLRIGCQPIPCACILSSLYVSHSIAILHSCSVQESNNGQPHSFKKCVVLCVMGLLCYLDMKIEVDKWDPHRNVIKRLGLVPLFSTLFEKFHVGIWSKMPMEQLRPLLAHLLPKHVLEKIAFVYSREHCRDSQKFPWCYKMLDTLF